MRYAPPPLPMYVRAYRIRLMPKIISASIPNARSSKQLHVSRRSTQSPRSNILPRRDPLHTTLPRWFRSRSTIGYRYATANAVDSSPLPLSYHTALASHLDPTLPCGVTESCSLRELEPTPTCLTNSIRIFLFPLVDYFVSRTVKHPYSSFII